MQKIPVDYTEFSLPFFKTVYAEDQEESDDKANADQDDESEDDEDEENPGPLSKEDALEAMQDLIPSSVHHIGTVEDTAENWTSWLSEDHFYLIPWQGDDFQWALFRISWDDNWEKWEWESLARIPEVKDHREAALQMFNGWMKTCSMTGPEYQPYKDLIDEFF